MIDKATLLQLAPNAAHSKFSVDDICAELNKAFALLGTNTRNAAFFAQTAHESGEYTATTENLNYSASALLATFHTHFDATTAAQYARQPEKIANRVYGNRMGNGDEASGEGWKFRGRGFIQLTGKDNYTKCGSALGVDLLTTPEYLSTLTGAMRSALWYWATNNLNHWADLGDMTTITKVINGGTIGLTDRQMLYKRALLILH